MFRSRCRFLLLQQAQPQHQQVVPTKRIAHKKSEIPSCKHLLSPQHISRYQYLPKSAQYSIAFLHSALTVAAEGKGCLWDLDGVQKPKGWRLQRADDSASLAASKIFSAEDEEDAKKAELIKRLTPILELQEKVREHSMNPQEEAIERKRVAHKIKMEEKERKKLELRGVGNLNKVLAADPWNRSGQQALPGHTNDNNPTPPPSFSFDNPPSSSTDKNELEDEEEDDHHDHQPRQPYIDETGCTIPGLSRDSVSGILIPKYDVRFALDVGCGYDAFLTHNVFFPMGVQTGDLLDPSSQFLKAAQALLKREWTNHTYSFDFANSYDRQLDMEYEKKGIALAKAERHKRIVEKVTGKLREIRRRRMVEGLRGGSSKFLLTATNAQSTIPPSHFSVPRLSEADNKKWAEDNKHFFPPTMNDNMSFGQGECEITSERGMATIKHQQSFVRWESIYHYTNEEEENDVGPDRWEEQSPHLAKERKLRREAQREAAAEGGGGIIGGVAAAAFPQYDGWSDAGKYRKGKNEDGEETVVMKNGGTAAASSSSGSAQEEATGSSASTSSADGSSSSSSPLGGGPHAHQHHHHGGSGGGTGGGIAAEQDLHRDRDTDRGGGGERGDQQQGQHHFDDNVDDPESEFYPPVPRYNPGPRYRRVRATDVFPTSGEDQDFDDQTFYHQQLQHEQLQISKWEEPKSHRIIRNLIAKRGQDWAPVLPPRAGMDLTRTVVPSCYDVIGFRQCAYYYTDDELVQFLKKAGQRLLSPASDYHGDGRSKKGIIFLQEQVLKDELATEENSWKRSMIERFLLKGKVRTEGEFHKIFERVSSELQHDFKFKHGATATTPSTSTSIANPDQKKPGKDGANDGPVDSGACTECRVLMECWNEAHNFWWLLKGVKMFALQFE